MANPGTVIAHVVKLVTTLICMKFFKDSYSLRAVEQGWAIRAFQIMLVHSILGIIRYSGASTTKRFRSFYEQFTSVIEIFPFAFFTGEVLLKYRYSPELSYLLIALSISPAIVELSSARIRDRTRLCRYTDLIFGLQACALALICFSNDNYAGMSLAVSYVLARYVSEDFCDHYEVPYVDLSQYSLSFVEVFALATLKDNALVAAS